MIPIQDDLIRLASEGRLIPFLGAGFSASLGLPSWESMLRDVCELTEGAASFDEILESTNGDLLQVAEYLFLRHDKQIGPIRHLIERKFSGTEYNTLLSGPHVELVNLGAGQIYTTNYDDIVEQTYRGLHLSVTPVILPKDVALANSKKTQVIKYHGDLAHEKTLILTESAYYKRLDFESPMDLKFRSDLLGKSVLFMGYSFRDVNIRIIWFKLMDMMRDIPEADRRPSYIVRFEPNGPLEELYEAVGLKTIVLNPSAKELTGEERTALLGEFLLSLNINADAVRGKGEELSVGPFVSQALLDSALERHETYRQHASRLRIRRFPVFGTTDDVLTARLLSATVPSSLRAGWQECVVKLLPHMLATPALANALLRIENSSAVAQYVVGTLAQNADAQAREAKEILLAAPLDWERIWAATLRYSDVDDILTLFAEEITYQATKGADEDVAYLADLTARIGAGQLKFDVPEGVERTVEEVREFADRLVAAASDIYPSIRDLDLSERAPRVQNVLAEVRRREADFKPVNIDKHKLHDGLDVGSVVHRYMQRVAP
ncbi:SIR2 family protein [Clavibacter sp. Sh2126]|uniref:SIR2 family protein n=1 Tax=Clavibacter sp. Sh2126 TaxID=3397678 RepID=UPI0039E01693